MLRNRRGEIYLFLSFIAVGGFSTALLYQTVKGGGKFQLSKTKRNIFTFQGSREPFFIALFFISHFTLSTTY